MAVVVPHHNDIIHELVGHDYTVTMIPSEDSTSSYALANRSIKIIYHNKHFVVLESTEEGGMNVYKNLGIAYANFRNHRRFREDDG